MTEGSASFYVPEGDGFVSTELTRGPWDPGSQHAGPPAALIGREIEALPAAAPMQVGRITFEILGPVPIAPLHVVAEVVRPGRRVEMVEATLHAGEELLIRARGWRLREGEVELPAGLASTELPAVGSESPQKLRPAWAPLPPQECPEGEFFHTGQAVGYHTAMEYRFAEGAFMDPGPAQAWMRMRHPLVAGEEPTPLQRVLTAADSGNGVSSTLDWTRYLFINVDLSVHLTRLPTGEWIGLDAITIPEPTGVGITDTALFDERGPLGRATQTLLVSEREAGGDTK
jgi:Thioesterase-like superfamily